MRSKKTQKEGFLPSALIQKLEQPHKGQILQMADLRDQEPNELAYMMNTRTAMGSLVKKYIDFYIF